MKKLAFAITAASGAAAVLSHHDAEASTQHKVQSGESLWTIAQQYNTSVESIKQNNNLSNNMVFPGQVINVGGSASQNTSSNTSSSSASSHTVVAGESLNIIANKYGVSVDALMQANHLNGYLIMPNQILTIPNGDQVVQQLKLAVIILHLHSTIKTYTLKVNAHGMCSTNVHKLVNLSVLTGLMQNTGRQMQRMMVIKLIILHLLVQLCKVHLDHMVM